MSGNTATSMFDLLKHEYVNGSMVSALRRQGLTPPLVIDGLRIRKPAAQEGLFLLTPEELLTLRIAQVSVNGRVVGYQRELNVADARKIAPYLAGGGMVPPITLALDGKGQMWISDGQHRAAGAVIARVPIWATVQRLDKDEQRQMFLSQRRARRISSDVMTLAGADPLARYVQEAVVSNDHPWSEIVSANRKAKTKISPYAAYQLLIRYVLNVEGQAASYRTNMDAQWDRGLADGLAPLISCFGNKQTNPLAFRPGTIQAVGAAAMWVFRRHEEHSDDRARWMAHMPAFQFAQYVHVRTQTAQTGLLIDHWNKRLSAARRVER